MFDRTDGHRIALAGNGRRRITLGEELRHQEQRDSASSLRRIGQARKAQVHDVLRHVLVTASDEDLRAGDRIAAVGLRLGTGAHDAEIGSGMGLGQAHGPGKAPLVEPRQPARAHLVVCVGREREGRPGRQRGIEIERRVRREHHFLEGDRQHLRHALAAEIGIAPQAAPAAFRECAIGVAEARRSAHGAILEDAALRVTALIQRQEHLFRDPAGLVDDHLGCRAISMGHGGVLLPERVRPEEIEEDETEILAWCLIAGHVLLPDSVLARVPPLRSVRKGLRVDVHER